MKRMIFLMLTLLIWSAASMNAQVTIGSLENPHGGALLDLSKSPVKLGLLLPHVALADVSSWQLSGDSEDGEGMMVYNTSEDTDGGSGVGVYVWKGSWLPMGSGGGNASCVPVITSPAGEDNRSAAKGGEAPRLEVEADGQGQALSYRWQRSDNGSDWTNILDVTDAAYNAPTTETGTFYYRCMVKNTCGSKASPVFVVLITDCTNLPAVDSPTEAQTREVNKEGSLTLSVTGNAETTTYQWQSSEMGTGNWTNIAINGTSDNYSVLTGGFGLFYYRCVVSNSCSSAYSPVFTVTVHPCTQAPAITSPGSAQSVSVAQGSATQHLSVSANTNGGTLSYQWESSVNGSTGWSDIQGATSDSYNAPTEATAYYRCMVSNECGETPSPNFEVQVRACTGAPTISNPTVDQTLTVNKNGTLELTVSANGNGEELVYRWQTSSDGADIWNDVAENGNSDTYSVPTDNPNTYFYRCKVSNSCATNGINSVKFTVTVRNCTDTPTITAADEYEYEFNRNATSQTVSVSATGNGDSNLTYQWQSSDTGNEDSWQAATNTGYNTATYTVPTNTAGTRFYRCQVTNACGTTASAAYTVTVRACSDAPTVTPTADTNPANQVASAGGSYPMTVSATVFGAASTAYQWQKSATGGNDDWTEVASNGNTATYNAPTTSAEIGTTAYYRCVVTTACGTVTSGKWKITVVECSGPPTISPTADETKITKQGEALALSIIADGKGATPTHRWEKSDNGSSGWENVASNGTDPAYTVPVDAVGTFYYHCVVTTGCGTATSKIFIVNVCPTAVKDREDNWYCTGDFGAAGTWMTMNLRSKQYADGTPLPSKQGISANNAADVYYWYPSQATSVVETTADDILEQHPEYGLLYTWAAATGRSETSASEGNQPDQTQHQGICPEDWHLPSDFEWDQLERVITASADYSTEGTEDAWTESWSNSTSGYRGTHGKKMKSATKVTATNPAGKSKGLAANGFDALLVGYVTSGSPNFYGTDADFWSNSSNGSSNAWARYLYNSNDGVLRGNDGKSNLCSVRCKKNDN